MRDKCKKLLAPTCFYLGRFDFIFFFLCLIFFFCIFSPGRARSSTIGSVGPSAWGCSATWVWPSSSCAWTPPCASGVRSALLAMRSSPPSTSQASSWSGHLWNGRTEALDKQTRACPKIKFVAKDGSKLICFLTTILINENIPVCSISYIQFCQVSFLIFFRFF